MTKPVPKYKIIHDVQRDEYIIQTYYGSQIGWSFLKVKKTLKEAQDWILDGVIQYERCG